MRIIPCFFFLHLFLVAALTAGCCLSAAHVEALRNAANAESAANEAAAMVRAFAAQHVTFVGASHSRFMWHTPGVPEAAVSWLGVPRPKDEDEVTLAAAGHESIVVTWGTLDNPLADAHTLQGAPVLLVSAAVGERLGIGPTGRLLRFVPAPHFDVRKVHSCGTCGGGMPSPSVPIERFRELFVLEGRTSTEVVTIRVPFDATEWIVRCDHENPG